MPIENGPFVFESIPFRSISPEQLRMVNPVLFTVEENDIRIGQMAAQIAGVFEPDNPPLLVVPAQGADRFAANMLGKLYNLGFDCPIQTLLTERVMSERSKTEIITIKPSPNEFVKRFDNPPLIIDVLTRTGNTLNRIMKMLEPYFEGKEIEPDKVYHLHPSTAVLFHAYSPSSKNAIKPRFVGWRVPPFGHRLEGFGLHTDGKGRGRDDVIVRTDLPPI